METQALTAIDAALGAGGLGVIILGFIAWYFKKAERTSEALAVAQKEAVEVQLKDLRGVAGEIKMDAKEIKADAKDIRKHLGLLNIEVTVLKERIYAAEKTMVEAVTRQGIQIDKTEKWHVGLEGFIQTSTLRLSALEKQADETSESLRVVESKADKVIVAVGHITRIRGSGQGGK